MRDKRGASAQRGQQADDGGHLVAELGVGGGGGGARGGAADLAGRGRPRRRAPARRRHARQQLLRQAVLGQRRRVHAAPREAVGQRGEAAQGAVRHLEGDKERLKEI